MKDSSSSSTTSTSFLLSLPDLSVGKWSPGLPPGFRLLRMRGGGGAQKETLWRGSVLLLTFLAYTAYHMSRKPISVVKNAKEFLNCTADR